MQNYKNIRFVIAYIRNFDSDSLFKKVIYKILTPSALNYF